MRTHTPAFAQPRAARLSPLAGALAFALAPAAHGYMVTTAADNGAHITPTPGSLREAILAANANCPTDPNPFIQFSGPFTISPSTPLPPFSCATGPYSPVVNGAYGGNVVINGPAGGAACGLEYNYIYGGALGVESMTLQNFTYGSFGAGVCGTVNVSSSTLRNNRVGAYLRSGGTSFIGNIETPNVITGNATAGIWSFAASAFIDSNLIGTANGSTAAPNGIGVYVGAGGSTTLVDNVISGNTGRGVSIINDGASFSDNKIGTNAAGTATLANGGGGVWLQNSFVVTFNGDVIAGNGGPGVEVDNSDVILFQNTYIGVNPSGSALPNTRGIDAFCSGYLILDNSYVSSNSGDGLSLSHVYDSEITGSTISDNGGTGIRLSTDPIVDCSSASNNLIHNGNTIGGNGQNGILIVGNSTGNLISDNVIFDNGVKNINLGGTTTTLPNDPVDADGGPNLQQNWPIIDSVVQSAGQTIITFHILTDTGSNIDIEAYSNAAFGKPSGEFFLDSMSLCGDCSEYSGTLTVDGLYDNISLTATVDNNTSEFSPMVGAPAVQLSRSSIDFGDVQIPGSSTTRSVVLRSIGDQPYVIDTIDESGLFCSGYAAMGASLAAAEVSICSSGVFVCTTNCSPGSPYATNQACSITATFAPGPTTIPGPYTTTIYICDNTAASPNTVQLFGNAILPPPIRVTPAEWDFGNVQLGLRSEARQFVVSNDYGGSIGITLEATGDFEIVGNDCGGSVPGEGSCNVSVEFVPTRSGEVDGELLVRMALLAEARVAAPLLGPIAARAGLIGTGVSGGSLVLPESIDVGAAIVGGTAATRTVELTNEGAESVTFSSVTVSENFGVVNNCPTVLAAGASCTLVISFTAPAVGPFTGTLTVVTDATGGSALIPLTALGQLSPTPLLRIVPTFIGFGDRVIGSQSANQPVVITNVGGAAATLSLSTSSIDFVIASTNCTASLESQASCSANVAFRPLLGFGPRPGSFIVNSNTAGSPHTVSLDGTGCRPYLASGGRSGSSSNCTP